MKDAYYISNINKHTNYINKICLKTKNSNTINTTNNINKINYYKKKQANIIINMISLYKLLYKLKTCEKNTICKCRKYILEYNIIYENYIDKFVINKKHFENRHHKYIYKIEKILLYLYREVENSEKQLFKISVNILEEIPTVFNDLLELGEILYNE